MRFLATFAASKAIGAAFYLLSSVAAAESPQPADPSAILLQPAIRLEKIRIAEDGLSFATESGRPFNPIGLTYFRANTGWAPQVWKRFDAEATRRDFAIMKDLGVNCVRVFLSYGSFCDTPGELNADGLTKFDQFLEIAESAGIYVHPTGPDHWEGIPEWARSSQISGEQYLAGIEKFWSLFAARYAGRNVIFAYDLRNEPEVPWKPTPETSAAWNQFLHERYQTTSHLADAWGVDEKSLSAEVISTPKSAAKSTKHELLDYQRFREELADAWTRRQVHAIKAVDPNALVTIGLIQWSVPSLLPGLEHYSAFRPERVAKLVDFLSIHFYPFADGAYEYQSPHAETQNLAYLEGVLREVARAGKPVVLSEFGWYGGGRPRFDGGKHPAATEEQQARWCRRVVETSRGCAAGWLNWGLYDQPEATDPSEFSGLLRVDGHPKAWAQVFRELANRQRDQRFQPRTLHDRPTLDWDACLTDPVAASHYRQQYLEAFAKP